MENLAGSNKTLGERFGSLVNERLAKTMRLSYDMVGQGPTLILLHGVVHRRQAWEPVLERLSQHRRVVSVDLFGHGESPDLPEIVENPLQFGVQVLGNLIAEVSDGGPTHIAGNSLGGWFALELAARGEVASATALSPAGFFLNSADQARTVLTFKTLRGAARAMGKRTDQILDVQAARAIALAPFFGRPWKIDAETAKTDVRSLLTNQVIDAGVQANFAFTSPPSEVPITVAWGRRDLILPVYQAHRVRSIFPHASVSTYSGLGHVPMSDDPRLVAQILLAGSSTSTTDRGPS